MSGVQPTRLVVADAHPIFAQGIAATLRREQSLWVQVLEEPPARISRLDTAAIAVVGFDGEVRDLWAACDHLMALPGSTSVAFVVMLPGRSDFEMVAAASLGARAILPRAASPLALRDAVMAVAAGRTLVADGLAEKLLSDFSGMLHRRREAEGVDLSPREREVLELIAAGMSNRDVSESLHISLHTVKNHVRSILDKLGVSSRGQAVAEATRRGVLVMGQGVSSPSARRA